MLRKDLEYPFSQKIDLLTLTGTTGLVDTVTEIPHGLQGAKILAVLAKVETATDSGVGPSAGTDVEYSVDHDDANVNVTLTLANSDNVAEKPVFITIVYLTN
jgi:hypothetical protein